jgi:YD repeat-containing protein
MRERVAACFIGCVLGCGSGAGARVPDPRPTVHRFGAALEQGQPEIAYALLDPELRAELGYPRFLQLWQQNERERVELGAALKQSGAATAHAEVELDDGEQVQLTLEDGGYKLAGGVLDAQALATPLDAVAALHRALLRQSLPGLLRVLSRERRAAWSAAFGKTVEQTRDGLDLRVEVHDDDAVVHLTGGGEVHLKREAGGWHVWDVK